MPRGIYDRSKSRRRAAKALKALGVEKADEILRDRDNDKRESLSDIVNRLETSIMAVGAVVVELKTALNRIKESIAE